MIVKTETPHFFIDQEKSRRGFLLDANNLGRLVLSGLVFYQADRIRRSVYGDRGRTDHSKLERALMKKAKFLEKAKRNYPDGRRIGTDDVVSAGIQLFTDGALCDIWCFHAVNTGADFKHVIRIVPTLHQIGINKIIIESDFSFLDPVQKVIVFHPGDEYWNLTLQDWIEWQEYINQHFSNQSIQITRKLDIKDPKAVTPIVSSLIKMQECGDLLSPWMNFDLGSPVKPRHFIEECSQLNPWILSVGVVRGYNDITYTNEQITGLREVATKHNGITTFALEVQRMILSDKGIILPLFDIDNCFVTAYSTQVISEDYETKLGDRTNPWKTVYDVSWA